MIGKSAHLRGFRPFLLSQNTLFIHITSIVCFNYMGFSARNVLRYRKNFLGKFKRNHLYFVIQPFLKIKGSGQKHFVITLNMPTS